MFFQVFLRVFLLSFLFTAFLFAYENTFLEIDISLEEQHIEPTLPSLPPSQTQNEIPLADSTLESPQENTPSVGTIPQDIQDTATLLVSKNQNEQVEFLYIPEDFRQEIIDYTKLSQSFLNSPSIDDKIEKLNIEFYKILIDVRGKMKQKTVKLWGVSDMSQEEFFAVFIHEFSHYLDLYFFSDAIFGDVSQKFYTLSWQSTKIVKKGQTPANFVSGYATTNKYEDFAESLTYYILHNRDFFTKAQKNSTLQEKYDFFANELFLSGEFQGTDFSQNNIVKDYYWDITKIDFESENFLQYLENEI